MKADVLIIGAGPAGLFAAHELVGSSSKKIILIDMGKTMQKRVCPQTKECACKTCDILEGEGGAGGFSDGKKTYSLQRGTQLEEIFSPDQEHYLEEIDDLIVEYGVAGRFFDPLPEVPRRFHGTPFEFFSYRLRHIGSDGVRKFIINFVKHLAEEGVEILTQVEAVTFFLKDGQGISGIGVIDRRSGLSFTIEAETVIVATGLQGSPWLEKQFAAEGLALDTGPAGIGMRVEAPHQYLLPLFKDFYDFKLVYTHGGMTFRSFCCNQNGFIVNENHRTMGIRNVNGHSYLGMKSGSSNFAIICKVDQEIHSNPQEYVKGIARGINSLVDGGTVVQRASDFLAGIPTLYADIVDKGVLTNPQARGGVHIGHAMPGAIYNGFRSFIGELHTITGLLGGDTLVYAPEVKYYGYKVDVDFQTWQSREVRGLYIVGNASGYLDSFVSAALTGMIAAKHIIKGE